MNDTKLKTLFISFLALLFSASVFSATENEKANNSAILAHALKKQQHVTVHRYVLDSQQELKLDYVDKKSGLNLLHLSIKYLASAQAQATDGLALPEKWKVFIKLLLTEKKNYQIKAKNKNEDGVFTLLGQFGNLETYELLKEGFENNFLATNISQVNKEKSNALHYALQAKKVDLVLALLKDKINANQQDRLGITPLYLHLSNFKIFQQQSIEKEWRKIFDELLPVSNLKLAVKMDLEKYYKLPIHFAAAIGDLDIFKKVALAQQDSIAKYETTNGGMRNTLSIAIENSSIPIVEHLFQLLSVKSKDSATVRKFRQKSFIGKTGIEAVKETLGVINAKGDTLIHLASKAEFLLGIHLLSEEPFKDMVDVNAVNLKGKRAIDFCFERVKKPIHIIEGIVDHPNINLGQPLSNGNNLFTNLTQYEIVNAIKSYLTRYTPKWNSIDENNNPVFLALLALENYDIYMKVMESFDELDLSLLNNQDANITHFLVYYAGAEKYLKLVYKTHPNLFHKENEFGENTLARALIASNDLLFDKKEDKKDPVRILIEMGIKFDLAHEEKRFKRNYAHVAIANGNLYFFEYLIKEMPSLFSKEDGNKQSPLHYAAKKGSSKYIRQILALEGMSFDHRDENRKYPIHLAIESGDSYSISAFIDSETQLDVLNPSGKNIIELLIQRDEWKDLVADYIVKRPFAIDSGLAGALAVESIQYIEYFLAKGADPNKKIEHGTFLGQYPIMIPIKVNSDEILNFFVAGFDPENPNEDYPRGKMDYTVIDSSGRSIYGHAIISQNKKIVRLLNRWKVPFHQAPTLENGNYLSHPLLLAASFNGYAYGDEAEANKTEEFFQEVFKAEGIVPDITNRVGDSWVITALMQSNDFIVSEALKQWPKLLLKQSNGVRSIDLVLRNAQWNILTEGIKHGLGLNSFYQIDNKEHLEALQKIFLYWGYSVEQQYLELINLGLDTDIILEAVDGLFEVDDLIEKLEVYTESYLKRCHILHKEKNQDYRIRKEDHRIYPHLNNKRACFSPDIWEKLSEKEGFEASKTKL